MGMAMPALIFWGWARERSVRPCLSVCTFEDLTVYWNGESCPKHPAVHTESPDSSVCSVLGVSRGVAGCTSKGC